MNRSPLLDRRFPYVLLSVLSLFPLLALAIPTKSSYIPERAIEKRNESETCGFQGDDNTYGLGIRLGVYFQWITSSLAYNFVPEEAITMRGVNNCFQASVFAGLLFVTITRGPQLYAVEAFMMLIFCTGGVCSGNNNPEVGEATGRAKKYAFTGASTLGSVFRLFLAVGFCGYGVWFVFRGMDNMQHPPCSTYAFFFTRVNLYGWFRVLLKILFTIGALTFALMFIAGLLTVIGYAVGATSVDGNKAQEPSPDISRVNMGSGGALIMFILAVELMVRWNHIQGVNSLGSTGQLLPLIIGVGGMYRVGYHLVVTNGKKCLGLN